MEVRQSVLLSTLNSRPSTTLHSRGGSQMTCSPFRSLKNTQGLPSGQFSKTSRSKSPLDLRESKANRPAQRKKKLVPSFGRTKKTTKPPVQAEDVFFESSSQFRANHINQIKKVLNYDTGRQNSVLAFMFLLQDLDPNFKTHCNYLECETVDEIKAYMANSGKIIKLIREIPECIKNGKIRNKTIFRIQKILEKNIDEFKDLRALLCSVIILYNAIKPRKSLSRSPNCVTEFDTDLSPRSFDQNKKITRKRSFYIPTNEILTSRSDNECKAILLKQFFEKNQASIHKKNCNTFDNNNSEINENFGLFDTFGEQKPMK